MQASLVFCCFFLAAVHQGAHGVSDPTEAASLLAIKDALDDGLNKLANWVGDDPCGNPQWTGVYCLPSNGIQYVHELRLMNMNFTGILAPHVGNLTRLSILNFMWNKLRGPVPPEIGKLYNLSLLLFDGNKFSGTLPPELGNLSQLNRLQIDSNNLSGPLPSSLQGLSSVRHIHLNNNTLTGNIPKELGQLPDLLHLLVDNNNLTGELPPELSNISTLVILQLDNNNFSGSIPASYSKLENLSKLSLRNCNLKGTIPDLSAMPNLGYLDLSQNQLNGSLPALSSPSSILTTIDFSLNNLDGDVPPEYYHFQNLEFLLLQNNSLDGNFSAISLTHNAFPPTGSVLLFNLQHNNFLEFIPGFFSENPNVTFRLYGNPVCDNGTSNVPPNSCLQNNSAALNLLDISINTQDSAQCSENTCDEARGQELVPGLLSLGECNCAYPLVVGYRLKSPSFATFPSYVSGLTQYVASNLQMQDYQVHVSQYQWEPGPRLRMTIKLFPNSSTHQFEQNQVENLYSTFTSWNFPQNNTFGPYELLSFTIGFPYNVVLAPGSDGKSLSTGVVAGIVFASVAFTAIVVAAAIFVVMKRRHQYVAATKSVIRQHERIKVAGVKSFSYAEMSRTTNNFDTAMQIGQGGYGKVYRAILDDGMVVAIKRAEGGSLQGSKEFFTEIELLSRVHHRNLVSLVGYCDDEGEQMLVYEYMANGTLRDHLNARVKAPLDFASRLQIALGSGKGILYLHTEANPPIYHRDIKSSNILLDEKGRAKVADFGLSKLAPTADLEGDAGGHVSTVVKGTPGYLDPEYFFTQQLTDKSDVYSFGVVLLEMVTGLQPIYHGKNLIKEVNFANDKGGILEMVDSRMGMYPTECMLPLVELAISCTKDAMKLRPSMAEVVQRLTAIWQSTPKADSLVSFSEASSDMEAIFAKHPVPPLSNSSMSSAPLMVSESLLSGALHEIAPR